MDDQITDAKRSNKMQCLKLLVVVSLTIVSRTAIAQPQLQSTPGLPPNFVIISEINPKQGELVLVKFKTLFVAEQRVRKVEVNGKVKEIVETVRKPVVESHAEKVSLDTTDIY